MASYTRPGTYVLTGDVAEGSSSDTSCIHIASSDVTLDCARHTVAGYIRIANGSSNVTIRNCLATGLVPVIDASGLVVEHSSFSTPIYLSGAERSVLRANTVAVHGSPNAAIAISHGHDNQVLENTIDGGGARGADDGVLLSDESNDTISDNIIRNVFDAGIESLNALSHTTIANNAISNTVTAGVGAYWCTAWQDVTITGNRFSATRAGIRVEYANDFHCTSWGSAPQPLFSRNVIAGNTIEPGVPTTPGIRVQLQEWQQSVSDNVIRGNTFGASSIDVQPLSGFVDGGGNVCGDGGTFHCR